jgi:hypothetical protein
MGDDIEAMDRAPQEPVESITYWPDQIFAHHKEAPAEAVSIGGLERALRPASSRLRFRAPSGRSEIRCRTCGIQQGNLRP